MSNNIWSYFNEREKALELEKNPSLISRKSERQNLKSNIIALIKLYKTEKGMNKSQVSREIFEFMEKYYAGFVYVEFEEMLDSLIDKYTKPAYREFRKVEDVVISQAELEQIHSYGDINIEKLLFCALVVAKSKTSKNSEKLYLNIDSQTLFKLAKVKRSSDKDRALSITEYRGRVMYNLIQQGWFDFASKRKDNTNKVLLYGNKEATEGIIIPISEMILEDMSMYYLEWLGEKVATCKECGIKFLTNKKAKKPTLVCKDCAKIVDKKKKAEWYAKNKK